MFSGSVTEASIAGLAFVGGHFLLSSTPLRARLVARLGEVGFQALFALFAALTLAWLIASYAAAPFVPLWDPPAWTRWIPLLVMPFAFILFVAALRRDNPTSATGSPAAVDPTRPGILAVTRHPMMWSFALWAAAHLATNGDAASAVLFLAILVLALGGTVAIDAKKRARHPDDWPKLAALSSNLPLAALLAGRTRFEPARLVLPIVIGLVLYGALLLLHPSLFGVSPLPV